jgi:hypothetical protein
MTYRVLTPVSIITNLVPDCGYDATEIVTDIDDITTNYAATSGHMSPTPVTLSPLVSTISLIKPVTLSPIHPEIVTQTDDITTQKNDF